MDGICGRGGGNEVAGTIAFPNRVWERGGSGMREILILIFSLVLIFKPQWFLKSTGEVFERKKRNLRIGGMMGIAAFVLLILADSLNSK
jgi:hypothetical protein